MRNLLIGLGSNLGHPAAQIAEAVRRLSARMEVRGVSSLYRSAPVGPQDQPDYVNAVLRGMSAASPEEVLADARSVEQALGRVRTVRDGPRTIDVDVLDLGGMVLETPDLVLPHPRMAGRSFVLVPLAEVDPEWRHPVLGLTAMELLAGSPGLPPVERIGQISNGRN